ncbi:hypothetical protein Tco_0487125 [Tanacetum coccineum]
MQNPPSNNVKKRTALNSGAELHLKYGYIALTPTNEEGLRACSDLPTTTTRDAVENVPSSLVPHGQRLRYRPTLTPVVPPKTKCCSFSRKDITSSQQGMLVREENIRRVSMSDLY